MYLSPQTSVEQVPPQKGVASFALSPWLLLLALLWLPLWQPRVAWDTLRATGQDKAQAIVLCCPCWGVGQETQICGQGWCLFSGAAWVLLQRLGLWWRSYLKYSIPLKSSSLGFQKENKHVLIGTPAYSVLVFVNNEMLQTRNSWGLPPKDPSPTLLIPPKETWVTGLASQGKRRISTIRGGSE